MGDEGDGMKLSKLIENLEVKKIIGSIDLDIKEVKIQSNSVTKGSLFICLNGGGFDGHDFVKQVENYGAVAVVTERELDTSLTQIIVENSRIAMSIIAGTFYGRADNKLKIIGVTGTNGKTTTTHYITSILSASGVKCGLIGTLGVYYANKFIESTLTTPDPIELHKIFKDMVDCGVKVVVMEVSAHAVYYKKVFGIDFEVGVFTNFSQDHLDFFNDMETYKKAKIGFFNENNFKHIVINSDDNVGLEILNSRDGVISYGINNPADVFAVNVKENLLSTSFVMNIFDCLYDIKLNLIGRFNVYNALAGATACALYGVKTEKIYEGLEQLKGVAGRIECVHQGKFNVFIDYAHTPDGLKNTLTTLKNLCANKLVCIFGCGGNRDKDKRPIMGEISGKIADYTILTSDNPRFEEPMEIISEIEKGLLTVTKNYVIIQDRRQAIEYALGKANAGDTIVVCGKGSERYQDVYGIKNLFNDKDTVMEILRG